VAPAPVSFGIDRYVAETALETPHETVAELQAAISVAQTQKSIGKGLRTRLRMFDALPDAFSKE
jgi:hypothetical protein